MRRAFSALLFLVFAALAFRLRVRDIDFVQEPDFASALISSWVRFFFSADPATLLPPWGQPYLDGINLPNAIGSSAMRLIADAFPSARTFFPTEDSFNIAGATAVNIVAYATACSVFYVTILRITRSTMVAAVAALALFLSPQMIAIGLLRVDYLMMLPIMIMFYCSVRIAHGDAGPKTAAVLGISAAFAATMKINGLFFLTMPAIASAANIISSHRVRSVVRVGVAASIVFVCCYAALMTRYWYFLGFSGTVALYRYLIAAVANWSSVTPSDFSLYFNVDLMREHGLIFIVLYVACVLIVALYATRTRDPIAVFLATTAILWSVAAAFTLKHERGGYHLVPVFIACIAYTLHLASRSGRFRYASTFLIAIFALLSLTDAWAFYERKVRAVAAESPAFQVIKRAPREWITTHVRSGETVCVPIHSSWALPINNLGLNLTFGPFDFPYLDAAKMAHFAPPELNTLAESCPLMVLDDFHVNNYQSAFHRSSSTMAARWAAFYKEITRRWPPIVFKSTVPSGYVRRVEIYDLRSSQ